MMMNLENCKPQGKNELANLKESILASIKVYNIFAEEYGIANIIAHDLIGGTMMYMIKFY